MKLNFEKVKFYRGVSKRDAFEQDIREQFADIMYQTANGVAALTLAQKIYSSEGEVEYSDREVSIIRQTAELCTPQLIDAVSGMIENNNNVNQ